MKKIKEFEISCACGGNCKDNKAYEFSDLKQDAIEDIKELLKENKALKIGMMCDLSEQCEKAGITEQQRIASLESPYFKNLGKIEYLKYKWEIKESEIE